MEFVVEIPTLPVAPREPDALAWNEAGLILLLVIAFATIVGRFTGRIIGKDF